MIPLRAGDVASLGPVVNDAYFGKVPRNRLSVGNGAIFFRADGKFRSKIGLSPPRGRSALRAATTAPRTC